MVYAWTFSRVRHGRTRLVARGWRQKDGGCLGSSAGAVDTGSKVSREKNMRVKRSMLSTLPLRSLLRLRGWWPLTVCWLLLLHFFRLLFLSVLVSVLGCAVVGGVLYVGQCACVFARPAAWTACSSERGGRACMRGHHLPGCRLCRRGYRRCWGLCCRSPWTEIDEGAGPGGLSLVEESADGRCEASVVVVGRIIYRNPVRGLHR